ncbi:protein translocase subunit SecF [Ktedonobacteria bacterium brp13]|nr:protein translocase subunit SecF [Ktedonobacteria bacterium brp13]
MINIVKYRMWFIVFSLIVIVPGLISLAWFGLNEGVDFTGGASVTLQPQTAFTDSSQVVNLLKSYNLKSEQVVLGTDAKSTPAAWVRLNTVIDGTVTTSLETALSQKYSAAKLSYNVATIKTAGSQQFTLVTVTGFPTSPKPSASDIQSALAKLPATSISNGTTPVTVSNVKVGTSNQTVNILTQSQLSASASGGNNINLADVQGAFLKANGPYFAISNLSQVGPAVAGRTTLMAFLAVIAASICIMLFVWFSFRKVPKAFRYGVCAIISLIHDALVVLGIFSILGHFLGVQIDSLFITGLLTVIGFSVHDTIVVFDRVRENMQRHTTESFEEVVNASLVQTMARSLNTSLTVLFTMLALTLFTGIGTSIHTFTLTLMIGIVSGTYSSIFNASMLLVIWEKGELGIRRLQGRGNEQPATKSNREVRELARSRG